MHRKYICIIYLYNFYFNSLDSFTLKRRMNLEEINSFVKTKVSLFYTNYFSITGLRNEIEVK